MFWSLGIFAFGIFIGWVWAHNTVADECEKLGAFYVGNKTYHCSQIKESDRNHVRLRIKRKDGSIKWQTIDIGQDKDVQRILKKAKRKSDEVKDVST
ncbi:hypothetical protein [Gynuella sp.]|uniref:hypothetical protein n=1 Tax=Gynuella sp. TaxID=2969146 RepID=UPI003D0B5562